MHISIFCTPGGGLLRGRDLIMWPRANDRPGSDHVTWGPMRGLNKKWQKRGWTDTAALWKNLPKGQICLRADSLKKKITMAKLKSSNCDKCYKTQKLKLWQNLRKSNCDKTKSSHFDKTQKLKLWQNPKILTLTKLINLKCDKTPKL